MTSPASYAKRSKSRKPKRDIYDTATDRIIAALEQGAAPWVRPWTATGSGMPRNGSTGRNYNGVNVLLLWAESHAKGYDSGEWFTYRQAKALGGNVRKGEKGTGIVFWRFLEKSGTDDAGEETTRKIPMARAYTVFNREQCDGLPEPKEAPKVATLSEAERHEQAERFIAATRADVRHGGGRAFYSPTLDYVQLPRFETFKDGASYYATGLHELTHWTGHTSRCARDFENRFGSQAYAAEELVAELGAAFLCAELGIDGQLQHPEYIKSWLKVLRGDKRAIFTAASKARQAAQYLKGAANWEPEQEPEEQAVAA